MQNTSLDDILAASNRLVADLCGPAADLGLSASEYRVLLLLWEADGLGLSTLAARPGLEAVESALDALQEAGYVERDEQAGAVDVWLTGKGRKVCATLGTATLCDRLADLQGQLEALRTMLYGTIAQLQQARPDVALVGLDPVLTVRPGVAA